MDVILTVVMALAIVLLGAGYLLERHRAKIASDWARSLEKDVRAAVQSGNEADDELEREQRRRRAADEELAAARETHEIVLGNEREARRQVQNELANATARHAHVAVCLEAQEKATARATEDMRRYRDKSDQLEKELIALLRSLTTLTEKYVAQGADFRRTVERMHGDHRELVRHAVGIMDPADADGAVEPESIEEADERAVMRDPSLRAHDD